MILCVSPLKWAYFWSSVWQVQIWYGSSRSTCAPMCTCLCRIIIVVRSCGKVAGTCMKFCEEQGFGIFIRLTTDIFYNCI